MHFNFKDILWAPAKALSVKRIFVTAWFLCLGLVVYDIFTYIALAIEGERLSYVYAVYGLLPFYKLAYANAVAQVVAAVGVALAVLAAMLGMFGVAAIEIEAVRGNRFFSAFDAIRFAYRRLGQIFVSELAIVIFMLAIVAVLAVFGVICRLPFLGDWLYGLFFVLPNFIIGMFTVFIFAVFLVSIILLPATAAADRNGEAFNSILETFSTVIRQPVRWLLYTAYALAAAKVASFVYAYFCYRSVQFVGWATKLGGGDRMEQLIRSGLAHLPVRSDTVEQVMNIFPGINWGVSLASWARGGSGDAAGYLMSIMLVLIFASIVGYFLAVIATAQARIYVVIRYIKDDYDISAEKPLFFEDEHVNPPIEKEDLNAVD